MSLWEKEITKEECVFAQYNRQYLLPCPYVRPYALYHPQLLCFTARSVTDYLCMHTNSIWSFLQSSLRLFLK